MKSKECIPSPSSSTKPIPIHSTGRIGFYLLLFPALLVLNATLKLPVLVWGFLCALIFFLPNQLFQNLNQSSKNLRNSAFQFLSLYGIILLAQVSGTYSLPFVLIFLVLASVFRTKSLQFQGVELLAKGSVYFLFLVLSLKIMGVIFGLDLPVSTLEKIFLSGIFGAITVLLGEMSLKFRLSKATDSLEALEIHENYRGLNGKYQELNSKMGVLRGRKELGESLKVLERAYELAGGLLRKGNALALGLSQMDSLELKRQVVQFEKDLASNSNPQLQSLYEERLEQARLLYDQVMEALEDEHKFHARLETQVMKIENSILKLHRASEPLLLEMNQQLRDLQSELEDSLLFLEEEEKALLDLN